MGKRKSERGLSQISMPFTKIEKNFVFWRSRLTAQKKKNFWVEILIFSIFFFNHVKSVVRNLSDAGNLVFSKRTRVIWLNPTEILWSYLCRICEIIWVPKMCKNFHLCTITFLRNFEYWKYIRPWSPFDKFLILKL